MPTHSLDYTIGYHKTARIATKTLQLTQFLPISYTFGAAGEVGNFTNTRILGKS